MIQFEDFEEEYLEGHPVPFWKWSDGEVQICLEPCTSGLCVGLYDNENWILAEKKCTNMPGYSKVEIRSKAVMIANLIYEEWKSKNVIE